MTYLESLLTVLEQLPDWWIFLPPALLIAAAIPLALFKKRGIYRRVAFVLGAAACPLLPETGAFFLYAGLFTVLAFCLDLLFLIPKRKRESRAERIYRKFKPETEPPLKKERPMPPKVCCYDLPPEPAEESGMRLEHVTALLEKLKKEKLVPADRLEVELISQNVARFKDRPLTASERESLSDALSSVLRFTAKYKL